MSALFSNSTRKLSSILACVARAAKRYVSCYVSQAFRLLSPLRNRKSHGKGKRRRRRRYSGRSNEIRIGLDEREKKREREEEKKRKRWTRTLYVKDDESRHWPTSTPAPSHPPYFLFAPNRALNSAFARSSRRRVTSSGSPSKYSSRVPFALL